MTLFEKRIEGIRQDLPPVGIVGYVTDSTADLMNNPDKEFMWTRYYLAPLMVSGNPDQTLLIGNFHEANAPRPPGFILMRDYGNGILLFRRASR